MSQAQIAFTRSLLARSPALHAVRAGLAEALLAEGDAEGAVAECSAALAEDPSLIQAWLARASAHRAACRMEEAAADFLQAAALAPERPMILVNLAHCYAELDRLAAAETCLRRAVALDPLCLSAQASLGSVLVRLGRLTEAEAPCRAALAIDPNLVRAHQNLSGILAATDPAGARRHRDAAYRRQQVFIERSARPELTVLVLAAADPANVPLRHLLPGGRFTLVHWYVEYATREQDRALPAFDVVFNAIGDADLAPPMPPSVARVLERAGHRVVNHPDAVARTGRADLPRLLASVPWVVVPKVVRIEHAGTVPGASIAGPVLVRPMGSHGGEGVRRIDAGGEPPAADGPCHVTQFIDYVSGDGWYRKYRAIFVDGRVFPYHLAISRHWMVHYWTAGMETDAARRAEEHRFLTDPEGVLGAPAMAALELIARCLGLDYGGIDFGVLADGRLVVFEANAAMLVHPEHDPEFAYRNDAVRRILTAFTSMLAARAAVPVCGMERRRHRRGQG